MIPFPQYLRGLTRDDELLTVDDVGDVPVDVVAGEALRANGPALRFERTDGVNLASGVFTGPDQMRRRDSTPWSRLALGLGLPSDAPFVDVLETVARLGPAGRDQEPTYTRQAASQTHADVRHLGLPRGSTDMWPAVTLGVASVSTTAGSHWAPVYGAVVSADSLRVRVPTGLPALVDEGETITIALGVPPAAITAAYLFAVTGTIETPIQSCGVAGDVPFIPTNGGLVPSATEVIVETTVADRQTDGRLGPPEAWEHVVESTSLALAVTQVISTREPVVPFSPVGRPLADDLQLTGLTVAAMLYDRVNSYWGISPVEWVMLPAAAELGACFVASDILYAGFEWQLANILFSFSSLFDTVVIVDEDVPPTDIGRVLGDIWVKAHPSRDWTFSEPDAPAATRPHYRQDGQTGSRLYVNAAWDPRWEETYIAPRVTFEQSFPESVRTAARDAWNAQADAPDPDSSATGATDADDG